ncbi:MAG: hypothetical protein HQ475_06720 [SAR202 cluster bacterium]|nr:hypothetical protein [SAR202 cluster bacterium]
MVDNFRDCAAHAINPLSADSVSKMIDLVLQPDTLTDSQELIKLSIFNP